MTGIWKTVNQSRVNPELGWLSFAVCSLIVGCSSILWLPEFICLAFWLFQRPDGDVSPSPVWMKHAAALSLSRVGIEGAMYTCTYKHIYSTTCPLIRGSSLEIPVENTAFGPRPLRACNFGLRMASAAPAWR